MKVLSIFFTFVFFSIGFTQVSHQMDTSWEVPELWDFHEVIYQLWHEAWPEKDTKVLKSLVPEIEEGYKKLSDAKLPGILRDKADSWDSGIKHMGEIIGIYKEASEKEEVQPLLDAAEALHSQFEELVRLIRPVSKEVDLFHQELYKIYHYYMPDYDYEKIKVSVANLRDLADNLENAKLPGRLKDKKEDFQKAISDLRKKVESLAEVVAQGNDQAKIEKSIESMHTAYQDLEGVYN